MIVAIVALIVGYTLLMAYIVAIWQRMQEVERKQEDDYVAIQRLHSRVAYLERDSLNDLP